VAEEEEEDKYLLREVRTHGFIILFSHQDRSRNDIKNEKLAVQHVSQ